MSIVGHDDLHYYRSIQEGLVATGNDWINLQRDFEKDEIESADLMINGINEISMRNRFRAWAKLMTGGATRMAAE